MDESSAAFPPPSTPPPELDILIGTRRPSVFFGPHGLRAGWGALLFAVIWVAAFAACAYGAYFLFHFRRPRGMTELTPWIAFIAEAMQLFAVLLASWAMARIERRSFSAYGLSGTRFFSLFARGAAVGFCGLSFLILILYAGGVWHYDGMHMYGWAAWQYGLIWALIFVMVAVAEEMTLRGYLLAALTRGMTFWPAAILLSLLFGALHLNNAGEDPFGIAEVVCAGLMLSFVIWRTGSLAMAFGIHAAWDWAQSFFYGTADSGLHTRGFLLSSHSSGSAWLSGGPAGPEGSILAIPVTVLVVIAVHFTAGARRPYPE